MLLFSHDTPATEIYTLSLHDALPIFGDCALRAVELDACALRARLKPFGGEHHARFHQLLVVLAHRGKDVDRKSTRLNSSHTVISYAVFCLKKKSRPFAPYGRAVTSSA